ncbi:LOW QUALITY PROTEIN: hypothetical protein ACHAW6_001941 [Cyclotella cf. meneghiniana]
MILSTKLHLHSARANITAAFVHAHLKPAKSVYIHLPPEFAHQGNNILKLKRAQSTSLSTLGSIFRNKVGINPTLILVSSLMVIAITCIDDFLFYVHDDNYINLLIVALKADDIWICHEGTAEGFLGVDISQTYASLGSNPTITLTQKGLTTCIVEALGLFSSYTTKLDTPFKMSPVLQDINGVPVLDSFNYAAVIVMLLYLSGHSCPDNAFVVDQCAHYTCTPKGIHMQALKHIG